MDGQRILCICQQAALLTQLANLTEQDFWAYHMYAVLTQSKLVGRQLSNACCRHQR